MLLTVAFSQTTKLFPSLRFSTEASCEVIENCFFNNLTQIRKSIGGTEYMRQEQKITATGEVKCQFRNP